MNEEKNIATGITFRSGLISLLRFDFHIKVKDRVLFSGEVGFDGDNTTTNPVEKVLLANDITSMKFLLTQLIR
jgi:iron complex outermembrane receptor protein